MIRIGKKLKAEDILGKGWKNKMAKEALLNNQVFYPLHPENRVIYNLKMRYTQEYVKALREKGSTEARWEIYPKTSAMLRQIVNNMKNQLKNMCHLRCALCGETLCASHVLYKIFDRGDAGPAYLKLVVYTDYLNDGVYQMIQHLEAKHSRRFAPNAREKIKRTVNQTLHNIIESYARLNYNLDRMLNRIVLVENDYSGQSILNENESSRGLRIVMLEEENKEKYIDKRIKERLYDKLFSEETLKTQGEEEQLPGVTDDVMGKLTIDILHTTCEKVIEKLDEIPKHSVCYDHKEVKMFSVEGVLNHMVEHHPYVRPTEENLMCIWYGMGDRRAVTHAHYKYVARTECFTVDIKERTRNGYAVVYPLPPFRWTTGKSYDRTTFYGEGDGLDDLRSDFNDYVYLD